LLELKTETLVIPDLKLLTAYESAS
jgi:hypothetical protein